MYFFKSNADLNHIDELCANAVKQGIVNESKYTNPDMFKPNIYNTLGLSDVLNSGVCCFYLNYDDIERHKEIIAYFFKNKMISHTKTGRLYNISFKLDNQTRKNEYGENFKPKLKLSNFIDLNTGKWISKSS